MRLPRFARNDEKKSFSTTYQVLPLASRRPFSTLRPFSCSESAADCRLGSVLRIYFARRASLSTRSRCKKTPAYFSNPLPINESFYPLRTD
jgi:hypothetical protein